MRSNLTRGLESGRQANAFYALGALLARLGKLSAALAAFASSLRRDNTVFEAWMRCGEVYSRLGAHERALSTYRRGEALRPLDGEARLQVGNSLRRLRRLQEAMDAYRRVLLLENAGASYFAEARFQMGSVLEMQADKQAAEEAYGKAIQLEPQHARALNNLASLVVATRGPSGEATMLYRRAVRADPEMFEAYNNLGGNLLLEGQTHEAVEYLEAGLRMETSEPQLHFNLGLAYRRLNTSRYRDAVGHMRNALRMNPHNKDYYWELARTYNYLNESGAMLATLDAMTRTLRNGWTGLLTRGENVDTYIHQQSPYLTSAPASSVRPAAHLGSSAMEKSEVGGERPRGVIIYLCCGDSDELRDLHYSLAALHRFFTAQHPYPVVILHDRLNVTEEQSLKEAFGMSARLLSFERIALDFPANMSPQGRASIPERLNLAGHQWSLGYRHMSSFFCNDFYSLDIFRGYDYYWRLDADSFLLGPLPYDVFAHMVAADKVYGYMVVTQVLTPPILPKNLHDFV